MQIPFFGIEVVNIEFDVGTWYRYVYLCIPSCNFVMNMEMKIMCHKTSTEA